MRIIWTLMAKVFAGEADQEEINALDKWSLKNENNKQLKNMLKKNWESIKTEGGEIWVDTDQAWMNVRNRLVKDNLLSDPSEPADRKIRLPHLIRVAAAVVLVVGLSIVSYLIISPGSSGVSLAARTLDNQEFGIVLPDGSEVDLNAYSKIDYRLEKSGIRSVKMTGEAWFNVASDPFHPFIVQSGDGQCTVLPNPERRQFPEFGIRQIGYTR
jgi:ferric-dicitrate binding protein FerR (iron transport regulator)